VGWVVDIQGHEESEKKKRMPTTTASQQQTTFSGAVGDVLRTEWRQ
jgi:hypothetical protein